MIHVVWGTKYRETILVKDKREILFDHILKNARSKDIYIDTIGGYLDHVHCLISLGADQNIAKVVQLINGESSFWSNKEELIKPKLTWADDYFAVAIGISSIQKVRDYIHNQEEHHRKITFAEEYEKFTTSLGLNSAKASND